MKPAGQTHRRLDQRYHLHEAYSAPSISTLCHAARAGQTEAQRLIQRASRNISGKASHRLDLDCMVADASRAGPGRVLRKRLAKQVDGRRGNSPNVQAGSEDSRQNLARKCDIMSFLRTRALGLWYLPGSELAGRQRARNRVQRAPPGCIAE